MKTKSSCFKAWHIYYFWKKFQLKSIQMNQARTTSFDGNLLELFIWVEMWAPQSFNSRLSMHRLFDCFITLDVLIILYQVAHTFSAFSLLISPKLNRNSHKQLRNVRPRPNVALFRRQTKLSELSSWKVLVTSGSIKFAWMSLDHPTRSIRLLQMARTSEDSLRAKCWS